MKKARWLTVLLVVLTGGEAARGQAVITFSTWGLGFDWHRHHRHDLVYSLGLSGGPSLTYFGNAFIPWPGRGVSVVSYTVAPAAIVPPVLVIDRRPSDEERELDLLLQRLDKQQQQQQPPPQQPEMVPPPAPPLPVGAPVSVFRPIGPEDRARAQIPAVPDERPPPRMQEPPLLPALPTLEADPKLAYDLQVTLGKDAFALGEYGRAERRFQQAIAIFANEPLPYFALAQAQFGLGKYQEAVAAIEAGLRVKPDWPNSGFEPRPLYRGGDFSVQLQRLADALVRYPEDPYVLFLFGYELWFDNRRDEARGFFQRARSFVSDPTFCDRFLQPLPPAPFSIW